MKTILAIFAILLMFAVYFVVGTVSVAVLESHEKNNILSYDVWSEPEKLPREGKVCYYTYKYFVVFPLGVELWFKTPLEKQDFTLRHALLNPLVLAVVFIGIGRFRRKNREGKERFSI